MTADEMDYLADRMEDWPKIAKALREGAAAMRAVECVRELQLCCEYLADVTANELACVERYQDAKRFRDYACGCCRVLTAIAEPKGSANASD